MRNLLTEAKSLEKLINAFQKRNPNIDIEGLKQLLLSDPTIVSNDRGTFIGKYATWIGNLFAKGLIKPGDLWELKKALSIYDQNKESLLPIEKYTSLAALLGDTMKLAQVAKEEVPAHKEALEKVYEDDEWVVYIPHTYRASRQIGQGTHWCTASSNPEHYEYYTQDGDLYVNIRKSDGAKFQLHFESSQAMNVNDRPVALGEIGISEGLRNFYIQRVPILSFLKIYYKRCYGFFKGLAQVELNGKWGFIDETGNEVIPCKYDGIWNFYEGLAVVALNCKYGFIDKTGKAVIPFKYDWAGDFKDGIAKVELNGKYGFIDKTGREVIPFKFDGIGIFQDGLAKVELNEKFGFIDKTGREICPIKYDWANNFSDELAVVKLNNKFGYIDTTGREVIPCKYDNTRDFSEGLVGVALNNKWGFVDKSGKEVIPCRYDYAGDFFKGFAQVCFDGKWSYIDKHGNWYVKKPSVLPESITKITISDIRYMVNECVNRLNEMGYNPREYLPRVRGGWTQQKITKQLKKNGSLSGPLESIRLIAEFDNVDELRSHIFWHGSKYIQTSLKPSIVLPKYQVERDGGGGYGKQYWGISLTSDKSIATIFGGTGSRGTWVHPVVLAKDAVVKAMPKLDDAIAAEDIIEELWNEGIDAIYIGGGESELLVLNPKCIANMEASQYYEYYRLYRSNVSNPSDEQLQELLDKCKMIVNGGGSFENGEQELETKRLMRKI